MSSIYRKGSGLLDVWRPRVKRVQLKALVPHILMFIKAYEKNFQAKVDMNVPGVLFEVFF